jgi:hypothetical protein
MQQHGKTGRTIGSSTGLDIIINLAMNYSFKLQFSNLPSVRAGR